MKACCVPAFDNLNELKLVLHDCYNWDLVTELLKRSPNLEHLFLEHENVRCISTHVMWYQQQIYKVPISFILLNDCQDEECICSDEEYSEDGSSKVEYSEDGCSNAEKWNTPDFVPICLVSHLKTISVRGFQGHLHEREAAKYLLENGEVLRKMTIYTGDFLPAKEKIYKEFSMFQRGSRTCQVEFIEEAGSSFDNDYVY